MSSEEIIQERRQKRAEEKKKTKNAEIRAEKNKALMHIFQGRVKEQIRLNDMKDVENSFTQQTLADEAKLSLSTLESYLAEKNKPPLVNVVLIAEALNVSIDYLAGRDVVAKLPPQKEQTAETLLKNLCTVIANTNLTVTVVNGEAIFKTNNEHICNFCQQIVDFKDKETVDSTVQQFQGFVVMNGNLIEPHTFQKIKENEERLAFIYHDITEEDMADYPEEAHETISQREKEWEEIKNKKEEKKK